MHVAVVTVLLWAGPAAAQSSSAIGQAVAAAAQAAAVIGTVSLPAPDGQLVTVPGVPVTLTCGDRPPRTEISDEQGRFRFDDASAGACAVSATLEGATGAKSLVVPAGHTTDLALTLEMEALHQAVQVVASAEGSEGPISAPVQQVSSTTLQTAPIASARFQDALPLIPGVVRGPDGLLNVSGSRSNQTALMLSQTVGTDPITGEDAANLPIDAVAEVRVRRVAFAPEYGLSTGAVTSVEMRQGSDKWKVTVNDLQPRPRRRGGEFRGLESWTPRFTIGGPLAKSLRVLESAQIEYSQTQVYSLPAFERDTKRESFLSFTRLDWTPSASNHFSGSAMVAPRKTTYAGLNTFNPQPVTPAVEKHDVFGTFSHQLVTSHRGVLDSWISLKSFDTQVDPSQGSGTMILAPDVNSGSYFNSQDLTSKRVEVVSTYSLTPFGDAHLVKVAVGAGADNVDGTSRNRPVDIVRANGTRSERIEFVGPGDLTRHRSAFGGFVQDSWTVSPRLTAEYGVRVERDTLTTRTEVQPRASFVATVTRDNRTVLRGGVGFFNAMLPLNVGTFDQTERRLVTRFLDDGTTPLSAPVLTDNVVRGPIRRPRSVNWTVELDREVVQNLFVEVGFQQRRTRFDPVVDVSSGTEPQDLVLRGDGHSRYRETRVVARYKLSDTDQIVGAYTHSSAIGNLNDFNHFFGDIQDPVIRADERGPQSWDAPNRFLVWSSLSLPWKMTFFPVLDVRTGFPVSVVDEDRNYVGARNEAGRYPEFVSFDMQLTKRFRVFKHNATIGIKVFNITNRFNPRDFQENLASGDPGAFSNGVPRTIRGKWVIEF